MIIYLSPFHAIVYLSIILGASLVFQNLLFNHLVNLPSGHNPCDFGIDCIFLTQSSPSCGLICCSLSHCGCFDAWMCSSSYRTNLWFNAFPRWWGQYQHGFLFSIIFIGNLTIWIWHSSHSEYVCVLFRLLSILEILLGFSSSS